MNFRARDLRTETVGTIRHALAEHGRLRVDAASIDVGADLYLAGLSSFAVVQLMLGLEETFAIEFPDNLINRKSFSTIQAMCESVETILQANAAA